MLYLLELLDIWIVMFVHLCDLFVDYTIRAVIFFNCELILKNNIK